MCAFSFGFSGDNTIAMTCLCRDEISATVKNKIDEVFGASFNTNGLGGVMTCGVTGVKAGLSHAPICPVRFLVLSLVAQSINGFNRQRARSATSFLPCPISPSMLLAVRASSRDLGAPVIAARAVPWLRRSTRSRPTAWRRRPCPLVVCCGGVPGCWLYHDSGCVLLPQTYLHASWHMPEYTSTTRLGTHLNTHLNTHPTHTSTVHDFDEPELSILKQRLARRMVKEEWSEQRVQGMDLVEITQLANRAITADLEYLISKAVDPTKADYIVITGVEIHNWGTDFDNASPNLEFVSVTDSYAVIDGQRTDFDIEAVPVRGTNLMYCLLAVVLSTLCVFCVYFVCIL